MKVRELTDEEVSCIITGLNYLHKYDVEFCHYSYIAALVHDIEKNKIYVGDEIL